MEDNNKLFLRAANKGQLTAVKKHLESGVDINTRNPMGLTALMLAASKFTPLDDHEAVVRYLLEQGADTTLKTNHGADVFDLAENTSNTKMATLIQGFVEQKKLDAMIHANDATEHLKF